MTETLWGLFPWFEVGVILYAARPAIPIPGADDPSKKPGPAFEECGADYVHPDDLAILRGVHPYGHLFKFLGTAAPYVRLLYSGGEVRVRPGLFTTVSAPVFDYGAMIRTLPPHTMRAGQVATIMWHYKRQEAFYLLFIDGKKHATRYFAADLVLAV